LLQAFRDIYEGDIYRHRSSNQGDKVLRYLFEDLHALDQSPKLNSKIDRRIAVLNTKNARTGVASRRGDGSFGKLVPVAVAIEEEGFRVARGPIADIEIGAESKVVAKAMIKQIDRVIGDLQRQVEEFKRDGNPICVGIVGVNFARQYESYEGKRVEATTGSGGYKHPIQEAEEAIRRLNERARASFDEFLILKYSATNIDPFEFSWVDEKSTYLEYSAMLTRIASLYERRF